MGPCSKASGKCRDLIEETRSTLGRDMEKEIKKEVRLLEQNRLEGKKLKAFEVKGNKQ